MNLIYSVFVSILSLVLFSFNLSAQESWAQFRGPRGAGIYADPQPLPSALDKEKNLQWFCALSEGVSSPCISGDRIFLTGKSGDSLLTICIDRHTGSVLWQKVVIPEKLERVHPVSHVATPTPTANGSHVFSFFGSYGLLCYDFSGNLIWERKIPQQGNMYGSAVSPILYDNKLIFSRDADENPYLEVIDPTSGTTLWRVDRPGFRGNWSTPMVIQVGSCHELVIYGIWWMRAYDLTDGTELWSFPGLTDEPIITPVFGDGLLFLTSYNMKTNPEVLGLPTWDSLLGLYDRDRDSMLLFEEIKTNKSILSRYDDDGDGDHPLPGFFRWLDVDRNDKITEKEWGKIIAWVDGFPHENALIALKPSADKRQDPEVAWRYTRGVPECPSPLYHQGKVWMLADGGLITCLESSSGELIYSAKLADGGAYYASPVWGDGKLFAASARGVVAILDGGPAHRVLSKCDFKERILATPALSEGSVYVRTARGLYAFSSK